jgi:hypothetical protein
VNVVSVIAICIAVGSLLLAIRADRRAGRAERHGRQGHLIVKPRPDVISGKKNEHIYSYLVRNEGPGTITYVLLWVVDGAGETISTGAGGDRVLVPGDKAIFGVNLLHPDREGKVLMAR